jgi:hypothetical protein
MEPFGFMLAGGHPNSLGRTIEVAQTVLADITRLDELVNCYKSPDEVVRLRVSNAVKRVFVERPEMFSNYAEDFLGWISDIDQASTKWTLAQLFLLYRKQLSPEQTARAKAVVVRNLLTHDDWIVLNMCMKTCAMWAAGDPDMAAKIQSRVDLLCHDGRKTVAKEAGKLSALIFKLR